DYLRIYSGAGTGGSQVIPQSSGTGSINFTGAPGQTLTVGFSSDVSSNRAGFELAVTYAGVCELPCTRVPAPGATTGPATACAGRSITLGPTNDTEGSGVSYQWYVSTSSSTGPWNPVGADAAAYTTSQSEPSWYYAEVTCASGPDMGASDVLEVGMTAPFICNLCTPAAGTSTVEPICSVSIAGLNNASCTDVDCDAGYVDYTGTVVAPVVLQGLSYPLTVTGNTAGNYTTHFTAFFDWDQDGTFEDVQPMGSINNDACNTEVTLAVTIPAISTGPTLMRSIKNYNASPTDPCGSSAWGQAHGYL